MTEADRDDELYDLKFYVQRNIRYHMRRAAFFTRWSRFSSFVGVFFGSAAAVSMMAQVESIPPIAPALMALLVAIVSAVELVVGVSHLAWRHNDLRRRYLDIDEKIQSSPKIPIKAVHELKATIRRIEADEPPTMEALELMVRNDVITSIFDRDEVQEHYIPLDWYIRISAHWINWDVSAACPRAPEKAGCT